jgi:hypothetical protein
MLAFYFDRTGELERADRAIRTLMSRRPDDPDTREMARSFYEYLLDADEAVLRAGGLSLEVVRRALAELDEPAIR